MLTNEVMGAFCLGVVWLNTLLIVAHVWQTQRALAREVAALGRVIRAKVVAVDDGDALARIEVAQVGRAITTGGPERILFTEAKRAAVVSDGVVEIDGRRVRVEPKDGARVWTASENGVRADDDFDAAYRAASTNRGLASTLTIAVGADGAEVWLAGKRTEDQLAASLVSDVDPLAIGASARRRAIAFVAIALVSLAGITALGLVRPWFSGWSTLGGVLGVAYFLAIQPLAVALREGIAIPEQRRIGGSWQR